MDSVTASNLYVTGGSGLVGSAISQFYALDCPRIPLESDTGWDIALKGKKMVVHAAALASDRGVSANVIYQVNVAGSLKLAIKARELGVRRFVFLSTAKVLGESTKSGERLLDDLKLKPESRYAKSKALAEDQLLKLHEPNNFEIVILRPTVVLSPRAKGMIGLMVKSARHGYPFPVLSELNKRSFISIDNLVNAVDISLSHPDAAGESFLVSDECVVSNTELFKVLSEVYNRPNRRIRVPSGLRPIAVSLGGGDFWNKVFGNFEVDNSKICSVLDWSPKTSTLEFVRSAFPKYDR